VGLAGVDCFLCEVDVVILLRYRLLDIHPQNVAERKGTLPILTVRAFAADLGRGGGSVSDGGGIGECATAFEPVG
jgi:hypothetical protein